MTGMARTPVLGTKNDLDKTAQSGRSAHSPDHVNQAACRLLNGNFSLAPLHIRLGVTMAG
jgi:hypothetical protein